jgi:hypothetical protein
MALLRILGFYAYLCVLLDKASAKSKEIGQRVAELWKVNP